MVQMAITAKFSGVQKFRNFTVDENQKRSGQSMNNNQFVDNLKSKTMFLMVNDQCSWIAVAFTIIPPDQYENESHCEKTYLRGF